MAQGTRGFGPDGKPEQKKQPLVQTTFQFAGKVYPSAPAELLADTFASARNFAINWLIDRFQGKVPHAVVEGKSALVEQIGTSLEVISIPERGIWSARLEHPDLGLGNDVPPVPGRAWTIDLSIAEKERGVAVGLLVRCSTLSGISAPTKFARPRVLRDWAGSLSLKALLPITKDPLLITEPSELAQLKELLENPRRDLPVVVLTNPPERASGPSGSQWGLNEIDLANRLLGMAFVVLLPRELTFSWSALLGDNDWGVYNGAVRIYRPGFNLENQSPFAHKLYVWDRILGMGTDGKPGPIACADLIETVVSEIAATRPRRFDWTPFIPEARGIIAGLEREKMLATMASRSSEDASSEDLQEQLNFILTEAEKEKKSYEVRLTELRKEVDDALELAASYEAELNRERSTKEYLKWRIDELQEQLRITDHPNVKLELPSSYAESLEWIEKQLAGKLRLAGRAARELKTAVYEDPDLVFRSLLLLADEYRLMMLSRPNAKDRWDQGLIDLGLTMGRSIAPSRAGEQDDEYYVKWPPGSVTAPRRFLEFHLRKGTTKDNRLCLAIYFFWDEDSREVVVGWLPSHLDNRLS